MKAAENSDYLHALADGVSEFRQALSEFLELHVVNKGLARGLVPAVLPRDHADPERLSQLRAKVSRAAGRAGAATSLTGMYFHVQGAGRVDPIAVWGTMTQPKPLLEPDNVLDACDQMLGRLAEMTLRARAEAPPDGCGATGTTARRSPPPPTLSRPAS